MIDGNTVVVEKPGVRDESEEGMERGMEKGIWSDGGVKQKQKAEVHEVFEKIIQSRRQNDHEGIKS